MIVAYLRGNTEYPNACEMQKRIIQRYLSAHGLKCEKYFEDYKKQKRKAKIRDCWNEQGYGGLNASDKVFPEWEKMVLFLLACDACVIIVDLKSRLQNSPKLMGIFEAICRKKDIQIISAIEDEPAEKHVGKKQIAIYHFTNQSVNRPRLYEREIDMMYQYVLQQKCWGTPFLYVDYSLRKSEHSAYEKFKRNAERFDVLLVTDFFHVEDVF